VPDAAHGGQQAAVVRPLQICGLRRRLAAASIDGVVLGSIGVVLGAFYWEDFAAMGDRARLIGMAIATIHLGLLNSRLTGGRTPGKWLMRIRLVDAAGRPLGVGRAIVRSAMLQTPFALNGATIQPGPWTNALAAAGVFGLFGALLYLWLANRSTRQSLHDIIVGSFVVIGERQGEVTEQAWRGHLAIASAWILAMFLAPALIDPIAFQSETMQLLEHVRSVARAEAGDAAVTVWAGARLTATTEGSQQLSYLELHLDLRRDIDDHERLASQVVGRVLSWIPEARTYDQIIVGVRYGYDIVIASAYERNTFSRSPEEWARPAATPDR